MRVMILGGDGYLGWPTAMAFRRAGRDLIAIDNYLRRKMAAETRSEPLISKAHGCRSGAAIFRQMTEIPFDWRLPRAIAAISLPYQAVQPVLRPTQLSITRNSHQHRIR